MEDRSLSCFFPFISSKNAEKILEEVKHNKHFQLVDTKITNTYSLNPDPCVFLVLNPIHPTNFLFRTILKTMKFIKVLRSDYQGEIK